MQIKGFVLHLARNTFGDRSSHEDQMVFACEGITRHNECTSQCETVFPLIVMAQRWKKFQKVCCHLIYNRQKSDFGNYKDFYRTGVQNLQKSFELLTCSKNNYNITCLHDRWEQVPLPSHSYGSACRSYSQTQQAHPDLQITAASTSCTCVH